MKERLCLLAVDEAHFVSQCITLLGAKISDQSSDKIGELRSLTDVPLLAVTATATENVQQDTEYSTGGRKSTDHAEEELMWLLQQFQTTPTLVKTIIFCKSYRCVYQVWSWLVIQLGDTSYDGEHRSCNRVVEMFTSSTTDATKGRILNDFRAGRVRVVVATVAFGLGIDIPDVRLVVHWGAPRSILAYWQEICRAGRDGDPALAVVFAYPRSIKDCDDDMKTMVNGTECVRRTVLKELRTKDMNPIPAQGDATVKPTKAHETHGVQARKKLRHLEGSKQNIADTGPCSQRQDLRYSLFILMLDIDDEITDISEDNI
ncbi:ATP-dependent helicase wrn-1-like [Dreissena polymorpha]|uniref:ATP-dependent helicase wrn-1-like n=1 Tax=Dreissena polymorpha TaxID=45954 RepID=UPI00226448D9|nr:ATP-dependent helicase wrn-1-like [Dreissena polymorpha]